MNPDRRPFEERLPASGSQPQSSADADADAGRSLRTFVSRSSLNAPSFHATEDAGTEAFPFPPLSDQTSAPQHPAAGSSRRRTSSNASQDRPDIYRTTSRNPSIRIRRRSNVSLRAPSQRSSVTESILENPDDAQAGQQVQSGRARSSSQPERGPARNDPNNLARHSRAVPQTAMPRLTEESVRPTMEELGFDRTPPLERPLSPTASLPDMPTEHDPRQVGRMRRMSRLFWPGTRNDGLPPQDAATAQREAEYNDELVDFLDAVGTWNP